MKHPKIPTVPTINSTDVSKKIRKVEGATMKHAKRFIVKRMDNFHEVRRNIAMWILATGIIIGATGLQFYWFQYGYRTDTYASDGTYVEAVLGPLDTLNPLFADSSAEESVSELIFSKLLKYDDSGNLNYDLAESMSISDDGKTYTFKLRTDAKWHDGMYVRAKDVVYTVGLLQDAEVNTVISGWESIEVKAVDATTVSFQLPSVYAPFLTAIEQLPILPEHILRDINSADLQTSSFSAMPVGSGPFVVQNVQDVDADLGRKAVYLKRNEDYYSGVAKLERIQIYAYESQDAIVQAIENGEANTATDLSILSAETFRDSTKLNVSEQAVSSGVYAILNTASSVLKDEKVRQALQLATDTDSIRASLSADTPELYLPFIASQIDSDSLPEAPEYDIEKAGELLDKAGWKLDGDERKKGDEKLSLSLVTTKDDDFEAVVGELTEQWRKLGVSVTTQVIDTDDVTQNFAQDVLQPRKYDVLLYKLTIGGDPDVYAYWHSSQASDGLNFSNYQSSISDEALSSARTRLESDLRAAKYITFAQQWLSDVPAIGLYQSTVQYVYTKGSHPYLSENMTLVSSTDRFVDINRWSVGSERVFTTP